MRHRRAVLYSLVIGIFATTVFAAHKDARVAPAAAAITMNGPSKIEAGLRTLVQDAAFGKTGGAGAPVPFEVEQSNDGVFVPVFIISRNVAATRSAIVASHGTISTVVRNIMVALLPLGAIETIGAREEIDRVEPSYYETATLDLSRKEIKADLVQAGTGLAQPYTGKGVIVGVLDSGIDWTHGDFKDANGKTRIISIWDQTQEGKPPAGTGRGYECKASDIDASNCPEKDTNGHGTHVAGIAAGNGRTRAGNTFTGIAPEADLVIVKAGNGTFSQKNIVDGVDYIFRTASALGKPAVVNLSLGGHFGSHDGNSAYEQSLSNMLAAGHLITAANGNEGADRIHVGYDAVGTGYSSGLSTYWNIDKTATSGNIEMWYSGSVRGGLVANVQSGNGLVNVFTTGGIANGSSFSRTPVTAAGTTIGFVTVQTELTSASAEHLLITVDNGNDSTVDLSKVTWEFFTFGSGHVDAWVPSDGSFSDYQDLSKGYIAGDFDMTVGMPATATNMIAVGSYTTKTQWLDVDNQGRQYSTPKTIGAISGFSSKGPTRDGRRRPIVVAPGEGIASTLSKDVDITNASMRPFVVSGGSYLIEQGTSQATPHITGLVALMMQARPTLNVADAYTILRGKARKDSFTGSTANNSYGDGKADALAYVAEAASNPVSAVCTANPTTLCLNGSRYRVTLSAKTSTGTTAQGQPTKQSDLFGYFSLPALTGDASNPEVFVKTVGPVNGVPWIFYAGLTNLDYTVTVQDTQGSFNQNYHVAPPPAGSFQSYGNFDVAGATSSLCSNITISNGTGSTGSCTASSSTLCLLNRFAVTLQAKDNPTRSNNTGPGVTVAVNSVFGFFTVPALAPDPSDIQAFVKMVDARAFSNNFWVFLGGLTDLDFTVTVRDTQRGVTRIYNKPAGSTCGWNDTQAFLP